MDTHTYALRAAKGFVASMEHYGNSCPPVGDGRMSTPAWYANQLNNAVHASGDFAGLEAAKASAKSPWWGWMWLAYAELILADAN